MRIASPIPNTTRCEPEQLPWAYRFLTHLLCPVVPLVSASPLIKCLRVSANFIRGSQLKISLSQSSLLIFILHKDAALLSCRDFDRPLRKGLCCDRPYC